MTPAQANLLRATALAILAPGSGIYRDGVREALAVVDTETARALNAPRSPAPVDTVVAEIRADLLARSERGIAKYGVTLDRKDLGLREWLDLAYEETLDKGLYLKRAMREIAKEGDPWPERYAAAVAVLQAERDRLQVMMADVATKPIQSAPWSAKDTEAVMVAQQAERNRAAVTPDAAPVEPPAGRHDAEDAIEAGCHAASGREAEWGAREQRIALTAAREAVYNFLERVTAGTTATAPVEPPHAAAPFLATLNPEPTEAVLGRAGDALAWHRQQMPVWVEFEPGVRHPYGDAAFHVAAHVTPDGKARLFPSKTAANVWLCANGRAPV